MKKYLLLILLLFNMTAFTGNSASHTVTVTYAKAEDKGLFIDENSLSANTTLSLSPLDLDGSSLGLDSSLDSSNTKPHLAVNFSFSKISNRAIVCSTNLSNPSFPLEAKISTISDQQSLINGWVLLSTSPQMLVTNITENICSFGIRYRISSYEKKASTDVHYITVTIIENT